MRTQIIAILLIISSSYNLFSQDTLKSENKFQSVYPANKMCKLILKTTKIIYTGYISDEDSNSVFFVTNEKNNITIKKNEIAIIVNPLFEAENPRDFIKIDTNIKRRIEMTDGSEMTGSIFAVEIKGIHFKTDGGITAFIPGDRIQNEERIYGSDFQGEFYPEDPNYTRLFLGPTAKPLRGGKGYFSENELFFPIIAVGVTDYITVGGGVSLFPFASNELYYLIAKVTPVNTKYFALSAGVLHSNLIGNEPWMKSVGITYAVGTYSCENASLTSGIGFGYYGGEFSSNPFILIGGDLRVSRGLKIISENWILTAPESVSFASLGLRFFSTHVSGDFGLIYPIIKNNNSGFPFFPWLGFTYNW